MSLLKSERLSWRDRLGIIKHFQLSDKRACAAFGISMQNLLAAYKNMHNGLFTPNIHQNFDAYREELSKVSLSAPPPIKKEVFITATKPKKENKKPGPKTSNIQTAFKNIPTEPVKAETFAKEYNVSIGILRQGKRFDGGNRGITHVKRDKESNELMIWREKR